MRRLNRILQNPFEQQKDAGAYEDVPKPEEVVQQTFCGT
jgi:hypothetical protein